MKMQIWQIYVSDGIMAAIHGSYYPIYEAYVPDLKLSFNHLTWFINNCSRYKSASEHDSQTAVDTPDPKLICEVELSREQIDNFKSLINPSNPSKKIATLINKTLATHGIDSPHYPREENAPVLSTPKDIAALLDFPDF